MKGWTKIERMFEKLRRTQKIVSWQSCKSVAKGNEWMNNVIGYQ